jgi:hypothetical protein
MRRIPPDEANRVYLHPGDALIALAVRSSWAKREQRRVSETAVGSFPTATRGWRLLRASAPRGIVGPVPQLMEDLLMGKKRKHPYLPGTAPSKVCRAPCDAERTAEGDATEGGTDLSLKPPKPTAEQAAYPTSDEAPRPSRFHVPG